jgi:hypothetical protein
MKIHKAALDCQPEPAATPQHRRSVAANPPDQPHPVPNVHWGAANLSPTEPDPALL